MEVQFQKTQLPVLRRLLRSVQQQEQTQEIRLTEDLPDIGSVIGCWGQPVIRSKEWHSDEMRLSAGVQAHILYRPEDGSQARWVECWIPVQMRWSFPHKQNDGIMRVLPVVQHVDARNVSARKLIVRAVLSVCGEGYYQEQAVACSPAGFPQDLQMMTQEYLTCIPQEAGEKQFLLEDEVTLPEKDASHVVRYSLHSELIERKVLGDKLVFRGTANVQLLLENEEGQLSTFDHEIPFSQYAQLENLYEPNALADIALVLTALEIEQTEEGKLQIKTGLTGQYLISEEKMLQLLQDAYSPERDISLEMEQLRVPVMLDTRSEQMRMDCIAEADADNIVDIQVTPMLPDLQKTEDGYDITHSASVQILYHDTQGLLCCTQKRWAQTMQMPCHEEADLEATLALNDKPRYQNNGTEIQIASDLKWEANCVKEQAFPVITGCTMGEQKQKDPARPSLILRRCTKDLWTLAKEANSTMDTIREVNGLSEDPEPGKLLLIPVK